jgi:hypothetical protein
MRHPGLWFLVIATACLLIAPAAHAAPITVSTGDLGENVIWKAGLFEVFLDASSPSNVLPANLVVKYGLWNSPPVVVSVFFNNTQVGAFEASLGYVSPGPEFASFPVTGFLQNGPNKVVFNGFSVNIGDYVIGQVDLNYDDDPGPPAPIPEPASLVLLGSGLLGVAAAARKRRG